MQAGTSAKWGFAELRGLGGIRGHCFDCFCNVMVVHPGGSVANVLMKRANGGLLEEELTSAIIGAFYEVYKTLGYGFLEHVYALALERELIARGHAVSREYAAMVYYKGIELTSQRLDLVVDEKVVVEIKSTEKLGLAAPRQLFSYLHATRFEVGLLLHFEPEPRFFRTVAPTRTRTLVSAKSGRSA